MSDSKFDLSKLKDNVGDIVGSLKSMINPTGVAANVDPDDALGLKIVKLTTMVKQLSDAQQEQVKKLNECSALLNGVFQDIEILRNSVKAQKAAGGEVGSAEKPPEEVKKE
jgi:hypothetical protein